MEFQLLLNHIITQMKNPLLTIKMTRMRTFFFLMIFLNTFNTYAQSLVNPTKAIESILKDVKMGLPLEEFKKSHPNAKINDDASFRVIAEEVINKNNIKDLTYYFDNEGDKPFYEVIIEFSTVAVRDEVAKKLFGKFNHPLKDDHWVINYGNAGYNTVGWTYETRLIYAGQLPHSEWAEDDMFIVSNDFKPCDFRINKEDVRNTEGGEESDKTGAITCETYAKEIATLFESGLKMKIPADSISAFLPNIEVSNTSLDFRTEHVLKINRNGLKEVTFYTNKKPNNTELYELVFEFENADSTQHLAELMFGEANHPSLDNHWVIGIGPLLEDVRPVSLAWVYNNKLVFGVNFPNCELADDESFNMPSEFIEKWDNSGMTPVNKGDDDTNNAETVTTQINTIIASATQDFEDLKGQEVPEKNEEYIAAIAYSNSEQTIIRKNAAGKWRLEARFTNQSTMDDAALVYENELKTIQNLEGLEYRLVKKSDFSSANGKTYIWDVQTLDDVSTGVVLKLQLFKTSTGEFGIKFEVGK